MLEFGIFIKLSDPLQRKILNLEFFRKSIFLENKKINLTTFHIQSFLLMVCMRCVFLFFYRNRFLNNSPLEDSTFCSFYKIHASDIQNLKPLNPEYSRRQTYNYYNNESKGKLLCSLLGKKEFWTAFKTTQLPFTEVVVEMCTFFSSFFLVYFKLNGRMARGR